MKFPCKVFPLPQPHPAFPKQKTKWAPVVNVRLTRHHSPPTRTIECWIDSGADVCLFHAGICHSLGISRVEDGIRDDLHGVVGGSRVPIYFHKVRVLLFGESFETMAGFCQELSVAGLLGLRGFFEAFVVTIDPSSDPPYCQIEKVHRA